MLEQSNQPNKAGASRRDLLVGIAWSLRAIVPGAGMYLRDRHLRANASTYEGYLDLVRGIISGALKKGDYLVLPVRIQRDWKTNADYKKASLAPIRGEVKNNFGITPLLDLCSRPEISNVPGLKRAIRDLHSDRCVKYPLEFIGLTFGTVTSESEVSFRESDGTQSLLLRLDRVDTSGSPKLPDGFNHNTTKPYFEFTILEALNR